MGYGPLPGPTLKRPCAILVRLVGRRTNTAGTFSRREALKCVILWLHSPYFYTDMQKGAFKDLYTTILGQAAPNIQMPSPTAPNGTQRQTRVSPNHLSTKYAMSAAAFSSLASIVKTPLNRQSPIYLPRSICYSVEKQISSSQRK